MPDRVLGRLNQEVDEFTPTAGATVNGFCRVFPVGHGRCHRRLLLGSTRPWVLVALRQTVQPKVAERLTVSAFPQRGDASLVAATSLDVAGERSTDT